MSRGDSGDPWPGDTVHFKHLWVRWHPDDRDIPRELVALTKDLWSFHYGDGWGVKSQAPINVGVDVVFTLTNLTSLQLYHVALVTLSPAISQLRKLEELGLSRCGLRELPAELGQLMYLKDLWLDGNPLEDLPQTCQNLVALRTLNVRLPVVCQAFSHCRSLKCRHHCQRYHQTSCACSG